MDIEYLLWLQGIREALGPFIEMLMNLVSHICDGPIVALVPCLLYWVVDKRAGLFVLTNLAIGNNINQFIKDTVCAYRPWIRDVRVLPSVDALKHATGYSFPSGHTQAGASTFGSAAWYFRHKRAVAIACTAVMLLIGFSRNFLGVHTPQDVIAGFAVAALSLWLSQVIFDRINNGAIKDTTVLIAAIVICAVMLVYTELKPYPMDYLNGVLLVDPAPMKLDAYSQAGILIGVAAGWFLEKRYVGFSTDCSTKQKLVRLLVCGIIVGGFTGIGQLIKFVYGRNLAYAIVKGLFPAFTGLFVGPAVSARVERRFDQSGTASSRESR